MVFTEKAVPLPVIVWPVGSRCTKLCDPRWPAAPLGGRLLFEGEDSFKMSLPWVDCLVVGDPLLSDFPFLFDTALGAQVESVQPTVNLYFVQFMQLLITPSHPSDERAVVALEFEDEEATA